MIIRNEHDLQQALLLDSETEHVEFKEAKNRYDFEELVGYCCALANEGGGSIVLGVTDKPPRRIVGTTAFDTPDRTKIGLFDRLHLRVELIEIMTSDGRVVSFVVPPRPPGRPVNYKGRYLMRAGSSIQAMSVDQIALILGETQFDFSAELVPGVDVTVLDPDAIAAFRDRWQRKSIRTDIANWSTAELLENAELTVGGKPTYASLILLGTAKSLSRHLAQAEAVFEYRSSEANIAYQQRREFRLGFFLWFDDIWNSINLRNDVQQFRKACSSTTSRLLTRTASAKPCSMRSVIGTTATAARSGSSSGHACWRSKVRAVSLTVSRLKMSVNDKRRATGASPKHSRVADWSNAPARAWT